MSTNYSDYLQVSKIISAQSLKSEEAGNKAHDEMLFIITHQVYELWFKQILFEFESVLNDFSQDTIEDHRMLKMVSRLERVIEIQKVLLSHVDVLETMTPLDFLEFRQYLTPASGFQSQQFRLIENKMGLHHRIRFNNQDYKKLLNENERDSVKEAEEAPSFFSCLEQWLERTPFLADENFDFWALFRKTVDQRTEEALSEVRKSSMDEESQQKHIQQIESSHESFEAIFDAKLFEEQRQKNLWRLSHRALQAALFVQLYRDEPLLQSPFRLMSCLQNIDENFTQWRQRHALMAHRMLGAKMGSGGSSGHKYLAAAADKHKVFMDLFNLATFLIPRSDLPPLPQEIKLKLNFNN